MFKNGHIFRPLKTLEERRKFYEEAIAKDYVLFLEQDPETECITIGRDARGWYGVEAMLP